MSDDASQSRGAGAPAGAGLRGWLSDILFPTLIGGPLDALVMRLGGRSTIDHPLLGRASGLPAVEALLVEARSWLGARSATYTRLGAVVGTDRDVAEGTLKLTLPRSRDERDDERDEREQAGTELLLPVAVVAERRRSREVELRVYQAVLPLGATPRARDLALRPQDGPAAPVLVVDHLDALRKGDADGVLACFESDGLVRDPLGVEHRHEDGGIREYYAARFGVGLSDEGAGTDLVPRAYADDGRACAIELTRTSVRGKPCPPQAVLAVYERGTSGLFHALRVYEDA